MVERELAKEGKSQHDLGREGSRRVWAWLEEYGGIIMSQFRLLGASLDYRRERFTMDPGYSGAVMRLFVHLYERGWIYRDNRMANWCPRYRTALSDLEVEHEDVDDTLSYVRYPLADGSGDVTIATVRPATILADVAVAVHPGDARYAESSGRMRSSRSSSGACRSSPTSAWSLTSAPAPSRSRRDTIQSTSRSAGTKACPS